MYRLLIVDDEKDICENIKYLLDWSLYNITSILTATSYAEAVSKAVDFQPHIALLDINLGGHWGYELAEHLRSMGMQTVFCMISGYDDFNYVHKSMQATARDYLLKPIHVAELRPSSSAPLSGISTGSFPNMPPPSRSWIRCCR